MSIPKPKQRTFYHNIPIYGDRPSLEAIKNRLSKLNSPGEPFHILKRQSNNKTMRTYWVRSWGFEWGENNDVYEARAMRSGNIRVSSFPLEQRYFERVNHNSDEFPQNA